MRNLVKARPLLYLSSFSLLTSLQNFYDPLTISVRNTYVLLRSSLVAVFIWYYPVASSGPPQYAIPAPRKFGRYLLQFPRAKNTNKISSRTAQTDETSVTRSSLPFPASFLSYPKIKRRTWNTIRERERFVFLKRVHTPISRRSPTWHRSVSQHGNAPNPVQGVPFVLHSTCGRGEAEAMLVANKTAMTARSVNCMILVEGGS